MEASALLIACQLSHMPNTRLGQAANDPATDTRLDTGNWLACATLAGFWKCPFDQSVHNLSQHVFADNEREAHPAAARL